MHTFSIPKSIIDRVIERRGREHVYDDLDPKKSALVVVDQGARVPRQDRRPRKYARNLLRTSIGRTQNAKNAKTCLPLGEPRLNALNSSGKKAE